MTHRRNGLVHSVSVREVPAVERKHLEALRCVRCGALSNGRLWCLDHSDYAQNVIREAARRQARGERMR